ncbi:MAG: AraC family ligand binding domain-containing protein [Pseudomonadota bacterium]
MLLNQYRVHAAGPLNSIHVEPGVIYIDKEYDMPGVFDRFHSHAFGHWVTCLEGSVRIEDDNGENVLRKGDKLFLDAHVKHGLWALEAPTKVRCEHLNEDIVIGSTDGIPLEWITRLTDRADHASL